MVTPQKQSSRGLRLPGVLGILMGIALVSSVGIPMWFGRPSVTLSSAADLLAKDLEELRQRASYLFCDVRVDFEENGNGYTLTDAFGTVLTAPVGSGQYQRRYDVDAVFRGVKITRVDIDNEQQDRSLHVDARGLFLHSATIELDYKGQRRTVFVDASNGMIEVDGSARDLVVQAE